jgi:ketosteroid isomerase-like protein
MSDERVETVRAIYEAWGKGDFRAGTELYDPEILLVQDEGFPERGSYVGMEGVGRYMRTFLDAWEQVTIEADELTGAGDSVVAAVTQRGVGQGSAAETDFSYFQVWTFRGDKVIRLDVIRERDAAFAAAGLSA